jgi:hypothetical protein
MPRIVLVLASGGKIFHNVLALVSAFCLGPIDLGSFGDLSATPRNGNSDIRELQSWLVAQAGVCQQGSAAATAEVSSEQRCQVQENGSRETVWLAIRKVLENRQCCMGVWAEHDADCLAMVRLPKYGRWAGVADWRWSWQSHQSWRSESMRACLHTEVQQSEWEAAGAACSGNSDELFSLAIPGPGWPVRSGKQDVSGTSWEKGAATSRSTC